MTIGMFLQSLIDPRLLLGAGVLAFGGVIYLDDRAERKRQIGKKTETKSEENNEP